MAGSNETANSSAIKNLANFIVNPCSISRVQNATPKLLPQPGIWTTILLVLRTRRARIPDRFSAVRERRKNLALADDDYVFKIFVARAVGTTFFTNGAGGKPGGGAGFRVLCRGDWTIVYANGRKDERGGEQWSD